MIRLLAGTAKMAQMTGFPEAARKLALVAAIVLCASAAHAQYTFTNVADTTIASPGVGAFNGLQHAGIRGNTTSFVAGYSGGTLAVFTANVTLTAIANSGTAQAPGGGTFTAFGTPVIISGNNTAFLGLYVSSAGDGIFTGSGGALTTIVRNGGGALAQVPGGGTFTGFSTPAISGNTRASPWRGNVHRLQARSRIQQRHLNMCGSKRRQLGGRWHGELR